jgi:hypothetical protein
MLVAGIGVSLATCGNHPNASWKGLLGNGLQRCEEICRTSAQTLNGFREILNDPDTPLDAMVSVAEFITTHLKSHRSGTYAQWLHDSIGGIAITDTTLACLLGSLGVKLATTNYDNLIEAGTGRSPITWLDRALATRFFREPTEDVLHLHGHYQEPDSVILGAGSYDQVCRDEFFQNALRSAMFLGTMVFVGCGSGLDDPNFAALLRWSQRALGQCEHSHFILVRSEDVREWRDRLKGTPIEPVPYGADYRDLISFLEPLAERVERRRVREPLLLLSAAQTDFDARWEDLERNREGLPASDYFRQSRMLADKLWRAGGRRRAAMAFSNRVTFQGQALLVPEYIDFGLDAAEWLLDDDLPSLASDHLGEIGQRVGETDIPARLVTRYHRLRVRCLDALCAYTEWLRAIEESLSGAGDDERARLEAERSEIHFLHGNFTQAAPDPE